MDFIGAIRGLGVTSKRKLHNDDLFVDRLNHRYTVAMIVVFAIVVTASQYSGRPINCWVPGHFNGNYESYADDICWVSSTYNIPMNEDIPHNESDRKEKMLKYYQWTPFILLLQAMLFYFPRMIWRSLNDKSGLDLQNIVDAVYNQSSDHQGLLSYLTNTFDHYVNSTKSPFEHGSRQKEYAWKLQQEADAGIVHRARKNVHSSNRDNNLIKDAYTEDEDDMDVDNFKEGGAKSLSKCQQFMENFKRLLKVICITKGKRSGNYLLILFIFCRALYTINSISQLFILNHFLGNDFLLLGIEVLSKVWVGDDWSQLKRFPRVTMCDFRIREVGIVHRYTVQCVLSINLFNEKIFIFLWFWLCLVSIFNLFDTISWCYSLIINNHERYAYVKQRLYASNNYTKGTQFFLQDAEDKRLFKKFVNSYLQEDGVLALRLLSRNSQDLIVSEVVAKLFASYKEQQQALKEQKRQAKVYNKNRRLNSENDYIQNEDDSNTPRFNMPNSNFSTVNETPSATLFLNKQLESSH